MSEVEYQDDILNSLIIGTQLGKSLEDIAHSIKEAKKYPAGIDAIVAILEAHIPHFPNYKNVKDALSKKFIMDLQSEDYYFYDEVTKVSTKVNKQALTTMLGAKGLQYIQRTRLNTVCLGYNPNDPTLFYEKENTRFINLYRPATWQFEYIYGKDPKSNKPEPLPAVCPLPGRYKDFFTHMSDGKELSYNFLINFLAATTQRSCKPETYLAMLGKQGVGKNTLIDIMSQVLGKDNVVTVNEGSLKDMKFNSELKHRKLILFDEVQVRSDADDLFLKKFVNGEIGIEAKGKDKKIMENFSSLMLASNSMNAVRTGADDRRYSFLDLPDNTLKQFHKAKYSKMSFDEYRNSYLLDPKEIRKLGLFLLTHNVDRDLINNPLQSEARLKRKEDSLNDWEMVVFDVLAAKFAGQEIDLVKATTALHEAIDNNKATPGRERWRALSQLKPGFFTVIRKINGAGERGYYLKFEKLDKQPRDK